MATGLATANGTRLPTPIEMTRSEAVERALIHGDLSGLSAPERWDYYVMRCEAAGLDPRSQPFQYLQLNGKLVLYATKATTDQLIASRHLTVALPSRGFDRVTGLYEVTARVTFPTGQAVEDVGAVWVPEKCQGEPLANAVMKCVTKAKRRTVLSACGLGMLDESEIDSIQGAIRVNSAAESLTIEHPIGTPAAIVHDGGHEPRAAEVSEARAFIRDEITAAHDRLRATLAIEQKQELFAPIVKEPQVAQALVSLWIEQGAMTAEDVAKDKPNARGEIVRDPAKVAAAIAVGWSQDPDEFRADVRAYLLRKEREALHAAGISLAEDESQATADDD